METCKILEWGNSTVIRVPKKLLNLYNLTKDDILEIEPSEKGFFIKKKKTLKDLFKDYDEKNYVKEKIDWDENLKGREML